MSRNCECVWPCGLHSTQSTHNRWWCSVRRARAVARALQEARCACAAARYAAPRTVVSLEEASALLLRLCVWPCGLHSAQSTHHRWWCLVRRDRAVALALEGRGARVRQHIKLTLLTVRFLVKGYGVYIENIHESSQCVTDNLLVMSVE